MITIDDPEIERAVAEAARRTGERAEEVARRALSRGLAAEREGRPAAAPSVLSPEEQARRRAILLEAREAMGRLPDLDTRSADEIIGYDEHGLPT